MEEIKCPNCGQVFQVDESGYAQMLRQVRDKEFEKEIKSRLEDMKKAIENEQKVAILNLEKTQKDELSQQVSVIGEKDKEIELLKAKISNFETEKRLAITEAVSEKDKEISNKTTEIAELKGKIENKDAEKELMEKNINEKYQTLLKVKDDEIKYYKDFKAHQSTKMLGETLEQHCMTQFNQIRMTAFPNAYFEKDNDSSDGSKGDFIFRDFDDGTEFISIMFEMKNEMDDTAEKNKKTNDKFFDKLDKDRNTKNCEYAVLVSMLESDSAFYNSGIVDVSYKYPKMYVIRPQFFIPMITLLRNAALNSLKYQKELQVVRSQQLDLQNFESEMDTFKNAFSRNYQIASKKFQTAIENIDKTISNLTKIKEDLLGSNNQLRLANDKAQDLSIKKLTKNSPSIRAMFEELNTNK